MCVLLIAAILLPQVLTTASTLEEALQAYEEDVQVQVPFAVGINAVRALNAPDTFSEERVEHLLRIATDGKAYRQVAPVIGALLATDGGRHVPAALGVVGRLPDDQRVTVVRAIGKEGPVRYGLMSMCTDAEQDEVADGALWLVVPLAPTDDVMTLLKALSEVPGDLRRARRLLQLAPQTTAPGPTYEALLEAAPYLHASLLGPIGEALAELVARSPVAAETALERANSMPTPLTVRSLSGTPAALWEKARQVVVNVLGGFGDVYRGLAADEAELLAAAVLAAGELRVPELLAAIPALTEPRVNPKVRVAALRALGYVGDRDAATIDRLIQHLEPPGPLADAAYASLRMKAGVTMPPRAVMWRDWRGRQTLVDRTPEEHAARLAEERDAAYRFRERRP